MMCFQLIPHKQQTPTLKKFDLLETDTCFQASSSMSTNCERPVSRYQPPDWHERNYKLANTARATREQSHNLRKEAQLLKV